ncbi:MAG: ClpXP protease specificity-enhancing factor SspB [Rhodospirillaceae bacterium]|nr:ClpXP protease specificity-enhancing factor SspB [Rhodospirillaceae bacterium]
MEPELLHYEKIVEDALRGVVRTALEQVATFGLPEGHGLYITFLTAGPGVDIPERLARTYPEEMTIVLEHQFWNLEVGEALFSVELSFNRRQERLEVPFDCVTSFADPSVPFGLKFELTADAEAPEEDEAGAGPGDAPPAASNEDAGGGPEADGPADEAADGAAQTGEVVNLDSFRKKR